MENADRVVFGCYPVPDIHHCHVIFMLLTVSLSFLNIDDYTNSYSELQCVILP